MNLLDKRIAFQLYAENTYGKTLVKNNLFITAIITIIKNE